MKKIINGKLGILLLLVTLLLTPKSAYAESFVDAEIQPYYTLTNSASTSLEVSSGTATLECYIKGIASTTSVYVRAELQKYSNGSWTKVTAWSSTKYAKTNIMNKTYSVSKGKYRVKCNFTVKTASQSESGTVYSSTKTY